MGSNQLFMLVLLAVLVVLYRDVAAQAPVSPPITVGFSVAERDALLALKFDLENNPNLVTWNGSICYQYFGVECAQERVVGIRLENVTLTGEVRSNALFNLTALSVLSFRNNSISGNLMDFSNNMKLTTIDMSINLFNGPISPSLINLNSLESLQLQDNRLSGSIPPFNQPTLKVFNVSNNNLSGVIPNTPVLQSFGPSSYGNNEFLCGSPSSASCGNAPQSHNSTANGSNNSQTGELLIIVNIMVLCILIALIIVYYRRKKQLKQEMLNRKSSALVEDEEKGEERRGKMVVYQSGSQETGNQDQGKLVFVDGAPEFELGDLLKASAESLGKGNFGNTYKARLDDGRNVVVKRLRDLKALSRDEFMKHLEAIADQKHPNLLPLLAYFYSKEERLLVHKFIANGNLFNRLHGGRGTKDRIPFRWSARLSVARAVGRALEYLHTSPSLHLQVPHGNLKSSNVLLDDNDVVLISDFGLTSIISNTISAQRMVAFKSPEYLTSKRVSKKSDVWSYGGLLLELLTGRISAQSCPEDGKAVDLCSWVHRAVREEWTAEIFDLEIMVQRSASHGMLRLLQIAVRCCDRLPEKRPDMSEVVREVENIKVINVDSESEEDLSMDRSLTDRSLTDDSMPATPSR